MQFELVIDPSDPLVRSVSENVADRQELASRAIADFHQRAGAGVVRGAELPDELAIAMRDLPGGWAIGLGEGPKRW